MCPALRHCAQSAVVFLCLLFILRLFCVFILSFQFVLILIFQLWKYLLLFFLSIFLSSFINISKQHLWDVRFIDFIQMITFSSHKVLIWWIMCWCIFECILSIDVSCNLVCSCSTAWLVEMHYKLLSLKQHWLKDCRYYNVVFIKYEIPELPKEKWKHLIKFQYFQSQKCKFIFF